MDRRRFLGASLVGGGLVGVSACAPGGAAVLSADTAPPPMSEDEVQQFLRNLEGQMARIGQTEPASDLLLPSDRLPESLRTRAKELVRKTLRTLLLAGSVSDLPLDGRVHPDVQARLFAGMQEMDDAASGMRSFLRSLTPTEQADIGRALRDDPDLGMRVMGAIDTEASAIGVPWQRRLHLRRLAAHICGRMKQSTPLFLDDTLKKIEKVAVQDTDLVAAERRLLVQLGEEDFARMREQVAAAQARWHIAYGTHQYYYGAPATAPQKDPPKRGTALLTTGGILMGFGLIHAGVGIAIVASEFSLAAWILGITLGGVLFVAGLVCLILGGLLRARS